MVRVGVKATETIAKVEEETAGAAKDKECGVAEQGLVRGGSH